MTRPVTEAQFGRIVARLINEGQLADREVADLADELTSSLVRRAYRIDEPQSAAQAA